MTTPKAGVISGTLANHPAPPDCRTMGPPCACPQHTWATPRIDDMINASHACELLGARVHFSGDSLIRDLWTATALWLLRLEGFDPFFHSPGLYQHAACMANQWKYLENFGIIEQMQAMGWLRGLQQFTQKLHPTVTPLPPLQPILCNSSAHSASDLRNSSPQSPHTLVYL